MRPRPRAVLSGVAALLATFAMAAPASAQVMTITGATPTTYSGPGETITFHVSLGGSNAVTNTVELTRIAYGTIGPISCVGLPLDPLESTTCSFTYVTQAGDVFGLNQSGTFKVTTLGAPRTKNIANSFRVPFVPVPPVASIVASTASVVENGAQSLSYTVTLSDPAAAPISVYFSLGGSATAGVDYAASANPLVIATGTTTGTITIDPTGDATVEADETVDVSLVAGSGYTLGAPTSATGIIANDDVPSLSINDVTLAEGNAGSTNATFTVSLSQPAGPGGVSFDIATANGTATAGVDYVASNLVGQTIPAGSSTYSLTVPVNGDTLNEPTETFFVNVTNVTNAVVGDGQGVSTIVNDDALPGLSIGNASVTEGNAGSVSASFVVTLSAASGQNVSVNYATANVTATAGSDYVAGSGTLTFTPGQTSQTLTVSVNGDTTVESDETFSVGLSGPTNASIVTAAGTGTILNDDVAVTLSPTTLPNATVAAAYSQTLTASGGNGGSYSFVVSAGALPAGLSLSNGGSLSGTPTAGGTFNFTLRASDSASNTGSGAYALVVAAPTITVAPTTLPAPTVGVAYSQTITANGGTAPYSYAVTAGSLPTGLSLSSAGVLSGTPTVAGSFNFTFTATDSSTGTGPYNGSRAYALTINVAPPVAGAVSATVAYGSSANPITPNLSGGTATSVAVATAAAHGVVTASGMSITYTPTVGYAGSDSFTYTASNASGTSAAATTTVTVSSPSLQIIAAQPFSAGVGNAYTQTFSWSGGAAPYSGYSVTGLPAGLSITGTTANSVTLSGTPTAAGSFNLVVSATDSSTGIGPFTKAQTFTLTVSAPTLVLTPAAGTLTLAYAAPYSQTFSGGGGGAPYSYVLSGTLPAGVSFNAATGTVSGTPTEPGNFPVTVTATDSSTGAGAPFSITQSYTLNISAPTITLIPASLPDTTAGLTYNENITATGGMAQYGFTVTSGALPTGLALSGSGVLSGTSTVSGTFNFTVTASDANGQTASRAYTIVVAAPTLTLTPGTLAGGTAGTAYSQTVSASGGIAPYSYAQSSGTLPAGLSFANGALSGTPTASGSFSFDITVTDSTGGMPATTTRSYTLVIAAATLSLDPASLPGGIAGTAYSQTVSASGGIAPYSYALGGGTLPAGLSFANGALSGTPTSSGSFTFDITATDSTSGTAATVTHSYTLVIATASLTLTPGTLPDGIAGMTYSQALTISGGIAPYTAALTGSLPAGLSFNPATHTLSGTPTQSGTFNLSVVVSDSTGGTPATVTNAYVLTIAAPTLALMPGTLPDGIAGIAYSQSISASGGIAPYSYALASGALPAGLSFANGALSGTPTASGSFTFDITATDSTGGTAATVTRTYTLVIAAATLSLDPGTLPDGIAGTAYSQGVSALGGIAPYSYVLSGGALPAGLSFANGMLSGTPTASGSFTFDITATDSTGGTAATVTRSYALVVSAPTLTLSPGTLPGGIAGMAYGQTLTASGGITPYRYALSSGTLPAGMNFANGVLSGTPIASGSFSFDITASDSTGGVAATVTRSYTLLIAAATLSLDPANLPAGVAGTAYSQTLTASGGIAPYSYALSSGALPAGLSFVNGALSGTPTSSGSFAFDITATDSTSGTAATVTHSYTLVIVTATLTLTPGTLPDGIAGTAYSQALTANGGIAPYTYALTGGTLPAGLSLSGTGVLAGTSTVAGSFTFVITASDSTGGTAATVSGNFTLVIAAPVITITPATLPDAVRGSAYQQVLGASGGTAAYAFALSGGALPAGVTLAADGTLAGTPTADGSFSFAVSVTDALGFTATTNYTWVVAMDPPVVVDDAVAALGGAVVNIPVTTNDTGAITSIAIAASPAHGTAVVNGLEVAYTPQAGFSGADSFRYTATGPGGTSAPATVKVTVNPLPVAVSRKLTANAGVAVDVDLTEGATGGPFTAATLVSLSPTNAGTANVAQVGSGDAARYVLTYTPAAAFSGLATVRFTLGNAYATSAEATIEFDVSARPDPSQDPEVRALLAAQAASTRRFATAQINNFQQRLENMHDQGDSRFSNQVSFSADSDRDCENQVGRIPGRRCEHQARNDEVAHADAAPADIGNPQGTAFGTWVGGVIRSGNHDGRGGSAGIDFESDGLSVGADYRLNGKFAFGGGLGWGRDDSDVGEHGSRSEGKAYTAALYASYHPGDRIFVDGLMGYQNLSYDLRRYVTSNGALVQGARDGTQWFASLSAGADIRHGEHLQLTPYARLDLARATLDAYTEHGDPLYSLRYADMDVDTTTGNLGLRVDYQHKLSQGLFSPQLRLEYQHDFQGNGDATMSYADQLSGPFYRTGVEAFDRNRFVIGLGAQFSTDGGLSTRIEYRGVIGDGEDSDHGLMLNIEKRY